MLCTARSLVVLVALSAVAADADQAPPPLPLSSPADLAPSAPAAPVAPPASPVGPGCAPPVCPYQDCNGRLLWGDPLLDPACGGALGWFGDVEVTVLGPHIKNRVTNAIDLGAGPEIVHLPTAELDWTAAPRFEVGYRFGQGFGEVLLSYRFLTTDGSDTLSGFDVSGGALRSRLNLNAADLDYGSREFSLGCQCDMKWRIGLRLANIFFDSRAQGVFLEERTSDSFTGLGPHAALELGWHPTTPEFGLYSRLEGALAIGEIRENFELISGGVGGALHTKENQVVPILHVQAGMSYTPEWADRRLRLVAGYDFESWWSLGVRGNNHSAFIGNGVFVRAEVNY
jgi:hypothetical protein